VLKYMDERLKPAGAVPPPSLQRSSSMELGDVSAVQTPGETALREQQPMPAAPVKAPVKVVPPPAPVPRPVAAPVPAPRPCPHTHGRRRCGARGGCSCGVRWRNRGRGRIVNGAGSRRPAAQQSRQHGVDAHELAGKNHGDAAAARGAAGRHVRDTEHPLDATGFAEYVHEQARAQDGGGAIEAPSRWRPTLLEAGLASGTDRTSITQPPHCSGRTSLYSADARPSYIYARGVSLCLPSAPIPPKQSICSFHSPRHCITTFGGHINTA
jgi:hypothetical protein